MKKIFETPIWLTTWDGLSKSDETLFNTVTNKLINYYTNEINKILESENIQFKFSVKIGNVTNDSKLIKLHDDMFSYAMRKDDIIASKVSRIYGDSKKTFSIKPKNKIFFTESDISWSENIPDLVFDLTPNNYSNMELVKWISENKTYDKIKYLHHNFSPPSKYLDKLNSRNKKIFSPILIELEKNGLNNIKKQIKKLSNKSLLVTNIITDVIDNGDEKLSEAIIETIRSEKIFPDIISVDNASYVKENDISALNILVNFDTPPWKYYLTEKLVTKLIRHKKEEAYFDEFITNQFDFYLMIAEVIKKRKLSFNDHGFIRKIDNGIKSFDDRYDIFLGNFHTFSFSDRKNSQSSNYLCKLPSSTKNYESVDNRTIILNDKQIVKKDKKFSTKDVLFCYVDLIKIFFIDVEKGIWGAELNLEMISTSNNPIELINFNNLSVTNSLFKFEKVQMSKEEDNNYKTNIYHITANFSFEPNANYYPFDYQDIYIEYSLKKHKELILQPVPTGQLDYDFSVEGWNLHKPYSSVKRLKNYVKTGTNLSKEVYLKNISRYGFILKRHEPANLVKSLAPLSFLTLIAYYCLYVPFDQIYNTISFLVVIFLAGIALYFSSDRPQPLSFSLIDKIFQFFYLISGVNLLYALSVGLNFSFIYIIQKILILSEPFLCGLFIIYIIKQKKDVEASF